MPIQYILLALLALLLVAGYLFLSHTIQKRRIRRQRLLVALKARRNAFRDLATGFPKGFLPPDLNNLLYRSLVDTCEHLAQLEPKDPQHSEQLTFYATQLESQANSTNQPKVRLDNPEQIREARQLLQELHKFIAQQTALKLISNIQAEAYNDQVKRLVLQMGVDSHIINARQAQQVGKPRLAIHHYQLARKLLASENAGHGYDKQIAQLDTVISKLQEKANNSPETDTPTTDSSSPAGDNKSAPADTNVSKEWQRFDEENEKWKKKKIYD